MHLRAGRSVHLAVGPGSAESGRGALGLPAPKGWPRKGQVPFFAWTCKSHDLWGDLHPRLLSCFYHLEDHLAFIFLKIMTWSQHRGGMDGMELRFIANNRQLLSKNLNQLVLSVGLFSGAIKELGALHRGLEKFLCSDPMTEQRGKNHSFKKKNQDFCFCPQSCLC